MSNEHAPTGGEGAPADGDLFVSDSETTMELDELFEILANGYRRRLLSYLDDTDDGVAAFSDLVDHVAAESVDVSTADRDRVAASLHHSHLPKLADAGVVEYDRRSRIVRYRGDPVVTEWVELAEAHESEPRRS